MVWPWFHVCFVSWQLLSCEWAWWRNISRQPATATGTSNWHRQPAPIGTGHPRAPVATGTGHCHRHPASGTAPGNRGTRHPAPASGTGTRPPAPGIRHPAPAPGHRHRHPATGTGNRQRQKKYILVAFEMFDLLIFPCCLELWRPYRTVHSDACRK